MAMAAVAASVAAGRDRRTAAAAETSDAEPGGCPTLTGGEAAAAAGDDARRGHRGQRQSSLADVPGPPVIAKTGTAEFGGRRPLPTHAWMIAAQGDLAVAVFVDVGDSGSGTAGPILEYFLREART